MTNKAEAARLASVQQADARRQNLEAHEATELARYRDQIRYLAGILKPVFACLEDGDDDLEVTPEMRKGALEGLRLVFAQGIEMRGRMQIAATHEPAPVAHCHVPIPGGTVVYYKREDYKPRVIEIDGFRYPLVTGPNWFAELVDTTELDTLLANGDAVILPPGQPIPRLSDEQRQIRGHALAAWHLYDPALEARVAETL